MKKDLNKPEQDNENEIFEGSCHILDSLFSEIKHKIKNGNPDKSYTSFLAKSGSENIAKKVIEEAFETAIASIEGPSHKNGRQQIILETADLLYHALVLLASKNIEFREVIDELGARSKNKNMSKKAIAKNKIKLYGK